MSTPPVYSMTSKLVTSKLIAIALTAFIGQAWSATEQTYICTQSGQERVIELKYPMGTATPCSVNYTKEGDTQTLWRAQNQEGYCEEKTKGFVSKQEGWGWRCTLAMLDDSEGETMTDEAVLEATAEGLSQEDLSVEQMDITPDSE